MHWEALNFLFCKADWLVHLYFFLLALLEEKSSSCSLMVLRTHPITTNFQLFSDPAMTLARSHGLGENVSSDPMDLHISNLLKCSLNYFFSMVKSLFLQTFLYVSGPCLLGPETHMRVCRKRDLVFCMSQQAHILPSLPFAVNIPVKALLVALLPI